MSTYYTKVKKYYSTKVWSIARVRNAVAQGWITEDEFEEITGQSYE